MAKIEQVLENAYDEVQADVVNAIKTHPQYEQLVGQLAEKGFAALAALIASA